jgi:hypothetical protein
VKRCRCAFHRSRPTHGADDLLQRAWLHRSEPHADELLAFRGNLDGARCDFLDLALLLNGLHGQPLQFVEVIGLLPRRRAGSVAGRVLRLAESGPGRQRSQQQDGPYPAVHFNTSRENVVPTAASRAAKLFSYSVRAS